MPDLTDPVPADDVGAELAVVTPHLPALTDFLDGHAAPLAVALGLDDDQFRALAHEVVRYRRITEGGRLMVGAYLHNRRAEFKRGEWTPYVAALAVDLNLGTETLGRWMLKAEGHYGLAVTKGAKPTLRGTRPKPLSANIAENPVSVPDAPAAAPEAGEAPGAGPAPVPAQEPVQNEPSDAWDDGLAPTRAPSRPPETEASKRSHTVTVALSDACRAILGFQQVELALWVKENRTQATAARGALDRALTDSAARAKVPQHLLDRHAAAKARSDAIQAAASGAGACAHPRAKREPVGGYAVRCKQCGTAKATGALLDADAR